MSFFGGLYELSDFLLSGRPLCAILVLIGAILIVSALIPPIGNAIVRVIPKLGDIDFSGLNKNQKILLLGIGVVFALGGIIGILTAPVPPEVVSFSPDKDPPQEIRTKINWTVDAYDKNGDPLNYKFYRMNNKSTNGKYISDMKCSGNTCIWNVNCADILENFFRVNVTDGKFERIEEGTFYIREPNSPPNIDRIIPSVLSPQPAGKNITFDVNARDPENNRMLYKFWLLGPRTDGDWVNVTNWIETNHWTWKTTLSDVGDNSIKVWVIDDFHQNKNASDDNLVDDWINVSYRIEKLDTSSVQKGNDSKNISIIASGEAFNHSNESNTTL
jgi:hypothetical protein